MSLFNDSYRKALLKQRDDQYIQEQYLGSNRSADYYRSLSAYHDTLSSAMASHSGQSNNTSDIQRSLERVHQSIDDLKDVIKQLNKT